MDEAWKAMVEHRLTALDDPDRGRVPRLERRQAIIDTGIALARWFGPFFVSVAALTILYFTAVRHG